MKNNSSKWKIVALAVEAIIIIALVYLYYSGFDWQKTEFFKGSIVSYGNKCRLGQTRACGSDLGECQKGIQKCTSKRVWSTTCEGEIKPIAEVCDDQKDNDCDGSVDCDDSNCSQQSACANAEFEVSVVSSMTKLRNSQGAYANLSNLKTYPSATINAAKNERESFQLIINTNKIDLKDVTVSVSDFSGPQTISKENVELFYEYFVHITEATDSLGGVGYWADALPLLNNKFDVVYGKNSAIWVKVNVPSSATSGDYNGKISVVTSNAGSIEVPVSLHVWDFSLPNKPSMTSVFGLSSNVLSVAYGVQGSALNQKVDEYATFMLKNKVVPFSGLGNLYPSASWNGSEVVVSYSPEKLNYLKKYINQYNAKTWQFPIGKWMADYSFVSGLEPFSAEFNSRFKDYIEKVIAIYQKEGIWNNGEYFSWIIDEPNTLASYEETNRWSSLVASANLKPKFMVTEQITKQNLNWSALQNINIWCPSVKVFATTEKADTSKYANKEWWLYNGGVGADFPSPDIIDREIASSRVMPWYIMKLGTDGYMYWSATGWGNLTNNPWSDPKVFDHTGGSGSGFANGDGYFFYPSSKISEYVPMNNIGGVTSSIRWEAFIDGIEDYEYLSMASDSAKIAAYNLVFNPYPFSKSEESFNQARKSLAEDIEKRF